MKNLLCFASASLILFSCGSSVQKKSTKLAYKERVIPKVMTEAGIFQSDSIDAAIKKASWEQGTKSKQLFMQGLDLYVNQKKAKESIPLFRESLLYKPDGKTYLYLTNAYVEVRDSANSRLAVNIANQLDYQPSYELRYAEARINMISSDTSNVLDALGMAFDQGFLNKKRIDGDKIFDPVREKRQFISMMVNYFSDEGRMKERLFKSFWASFPEVKLPFEMSEDSVRSTADDGYINYDFAPFIAGMEDGRFSRMVSAEYIMVGKYKANPNLYAILYKSFQTMGDTLPATSINLVIFDSLGNKMEEKVFASFTAPVDLTLGRIEEDGTVTIKDLKIRWKNNPTEEGYAGNERLGEGVVKETKYKINTLGKFEEVTEGTVAKK